MKNTNESQLPRPRRWTLPLIILSILGIGVIAAGAAIWWFNRPIEATVLSPPEEQVLQTKLHALEAADDKPEYVPGKKEIVLSQRELNGLLHKNTGWGEQVKLELATNAVHARISADIPEDAPFIGGRKLKGRARFLIADDTGNPALILEDLTVWGVSLPNAWLGDLKGQNLLTSLFGSSSGPPAGIEDISIAKGELLIKLAD